MKKRNRLSHSSRLTDPARNEDRNQFNNKSQSLEDVRERVFMTYLGSFQTGR